VNLAVLNITECSTQRLSLLTVKALSGRERERERERDVISGRGMYERGIMGEMREKA
jgi:hypothetical protein